MECLAGKVPEHLMKALCLGTQLYTTESLTTAVLITIRAWRTMAVIFSMTTVTEKRGHLAVLEAVQQQEQTVMMALLLKLHLSPRPQRRPKMEPEEPVLPGYSFDGWYLENGYRWNFDSDTVGADMELEARFSLAPEEASSIGRALQVLGEKAGIRGMIGGQVIDVSKTGQAVEKEVLDTIYELKTGALIEASMMVGAILAGASEEEIKTVEKIASCVGLAFQIQDDILDVTSTPEVLGKPVHSDEKNEKTTYVTLMGASEAARIVEERSNEAIRLLNTLPGENPYLAQLLVQLIHRDR